MAGKWIYEKWDWAVDWDVFFSQASGSVSLDGSYRFHTIDNRGEMSEEKVYGGSVPVQGVCILAKVGGSDHPAIYNESSDLTRIYRKINVINDAIAVKTNKQLVLTYAQKTTLLETIKAEEGTYPDDGIQGDYWYVKVKRAFPPVYYKDDQGQVHTIGRAFYKDLDGQVKELTDIKFKG